MIEFTQECWSRSFVRCSSMSCQVVRMVTNGQQLIVEASSALTSVTDTDGNPYTRLDDPTRWISTDVRSGYPIVTVQFRETQEGAWVRVLVPVLVDPWEYGQ